MSELYHAMIAAFAEKLRSGHWILPAKLEDDWKFDPWREFIRQNPAASDFVKQFEVEQAYVLSWNQLCNAVAQAIEAR